MNKGIFAGKDSKGSEGCPLEDKANLTWATGQHKFWAMHWLGIGTER